MSRVCRLFVANASSVLHVFIKSGRTPIFVFYDQISLWVGLNASAFFYVYLRALLGIQSLNCDRYLLDTSDIRSFHDKQKNTVNYCAMRKRSFLQYPGYNQIYFYCDCLVLVNIDFSKFSLKEEYCENISANMFTKVKEKERIVVYLSSFPSLF